MTDDDLRLAKERLMKLWDAYESQELELQGAMKKVNSLESRNSDKDRVLETLRELVESKDKEIGKLEIDRSSLDRESSDYRTNLRKRPHHSTRRGPDTRSSS